MDKSIEKGRKMLFITRWYLIVMYAAITGLSIYLFVIGGWLCLSLYTAPLALLLVLTAVQEIVYHKRRTTTGFTLKFISMAKTTIPMAWLIGATMPLIFLVRRLYMFLFPTMILLYLFTLVLEIIRLERVFALTTE